MADPLVIVADLLSPAFEAVAGESVDPVVRPSEHADAQANGALGLAKRLGRPPRDIAAAVVEAARSLDGKATLEVAGPGFINVTFAEPFLLEQLQALASDDLLGVRPTRVPERVVVDYSAPNIAKEMHIGHLRTTVIGDALVRMLEFVGHTVIRENHIGDWGTPFGMLIEHLLDLGDAEASGLAVNDLDAFYKQARAEFDSNEAFQERARRRVVLLQSGDPETLRLWKALVDVSMGHFDALYRKIGVLLTNDDLAGESSYHDLLPEVVERLRAVGLLQQSDGADVVFPPGYTNREGEPLPLIVQKRGGGFNYGTSDLACVLDRVERVKATLLIYVVGAPQSQHLAMVFDVASMAGWLRPPARAVHVAFGNVLGPDRKMLKSRSGEPARVVDVVDEAIERAIAAVREKNPDLAADEQEYVGHIVGIGALKYADLSTDRIKDYVFDWDRMLAFEGNTGPYLQYAHARIRSILRKADATPSMVPLGVTLSAHERDLVLQLLQFDAAIQDTLDKYSPHRLCNYLFEMAQAFTAFYEACPVLKAEGATRDLRLHLCEQTARVLAKGLDLLGIQAPERM